MGDFQVSERLHPHSIQPEIDEQKPGLNGECHVRRSSRDSRLSKSGDTRASSLAHNSLQDATRCSIRREKKGTREC
jgi:hypothetical protein